LKEASLIFAGGGGLGELPKNENDCLGAGGAGATSERERALDLGGRTIQAGGEGAGGVATGCRGLAKKENGWGAGFDATQHLRGRSGAAEKRK
jgi:hypothetical protein